MVFDANLFNAQPGTKIREDRFSEVELGVAFKQLTCFRCDHTALYKYRVQQLRRKPKVETSSDFEFGTGQQEIWKTIPRFAEIPETIKCEQCGEVLGLYPFCIF